jgi:predicted helicase
MRFFRKTLQFESGCSSRLHRVITTYDIGIAKVIRDFREAKHSLITNARCLTEGIDVPAVDMVAFIDPRYSKIDIAQATGRAMRKPRGSDKTLGYIVVHGKHATVAASFALRPSHELSTLVANQQQV